MKKIILTLIYFGLPMLAISQDFLEEDDRKVSIVKIQDALADDSFELSASEKETLSQKVILSKRMDLILALLAESKIQSFLAEKIRELPENDFKVSIIAESLKKNELWVERQKVNKGDQMTMMTSLCENTLRHYFPDDPVDWSEFSNVNARKTLADNLIKALNGDDVRKRDKSLYPSLPSHESSLESDLSFEEGWSDNEKKDSRRGIQNGSRENNLDDRKNLESSNRPNQTAHRQKEIAEKKKSNAPWIIVGVLLSGILALLLKVLKIRSAR